MLDLKTLRRLTTQGKQYDYLCFYGHQPSKSGQVTASCLSQWFVAPFTVADILYPTAEHWMMAEKARLFGDTGILTQILESKEPKTAKSLGRKVKRFDHQVWEANARRIVTEGNVAKFSQNRHILEFLLSTEDAVLVEASPYDKIWGIGLAASDPWSKDPQQWLGQNLLGFALMDVRTHLRNGDAT